MARDNWIIDADNFNLQTGKDILLLNEEMQGFLDKDNSIQSFVVATKGIGKTILLKMKRETMASFVMIPESGIDKFAFSDNLSRDSVELFRDLHNVECIWSIAIIMAVLRRVNYKLGADTLCRFLSGLYENRKVGSVSEYFSYLIHADRDDYFRAKADLESTLVPVYKRAVSSPIAIFIDNIDEYFNKHLEPGATESIAGVLEPELWYTSQMGLVLSFFNLHKFNHHIKLFASIRKEALLRYKREQVLFQQVSERTLDLRYSNLELERIFVNNVRREPKDRFVDPSRAAKNPIAAYFGFDTIRHKQVNNNEDLFQYIVRHTLSRPRDLMQIGKALSRLAPEERSQDSIRKVVHEVSGDIVSTYMSEVRPHIKPIDLPRLLALIDTNALTADAIKAICCEYNTSGPEDTARRNGAAALSGEDLAEMDCRTCGGTPVFFTLYKLGLLGHIIDDGSKNSRIQKFCLPGEKTFEDDGILPDSELFLIHPILNAMIMERNRTYIGNRNKRNIVGNGLRWSIEAAGGAARKKYCVLKADVCGFSKIMDQGPARTLAVKKKIAEFATSERLGCEFVNYSEGDAVSIVEKSAERIADAAFQLLDQVKKLGLEVRVAIDCGPMTIASATEMTGSPFLVSARVEPFVEANRIWCTEAVKRELERVKSIYEIVDLENELPESLAARRSAEGFSIGKEGQKELRLRLYRLRRD
jgi:class 3 adenylate cyclase